MDAFKLIVMLLMMVTIILQVKQFTDSNDNRGLVLNAIYVAIIVALVTTTDFLPWL